MSLKFGSRLITNFYKTFSLDFLMKEDKKESLTRLKNDYIKIQEKYDLPSFENMNEDFHIERIAEDETEILIREVRKFMANKFSDYLRFVEAILNPVNTPMFIFSVIKTINTVEKNKLTEIYKKLAKIEVRLIALDIEFSEEKEAEFVKESFNIWQEIKIDLLSVVETIDKNLDNKFEVNGGSYLG